MRRARLVQRVNRSLQPNDILLFNFDQARRVSALRCDTVMHTGLQALDAIMGEFNYFLKLLCPESGHCCDVQAKLLAFSVISRG